jgi:RNA polymerase sigma-70 factor (ECF subfamily)
MWPDQDKTRELLTQAQDGRPEAVDRLLERHRESLRRMIDARLNRGLARRVDASDVVQEALITATRRLPGYLENPAMPFHAWLRHIARDRLADVYRRQLAEKRNVAREESIAHDAPSSLNPAAQAAADDPTPGAILIGAELAGQFAAAVEQLPEEARDIILMRHAEQLTNAQAAELLGLSDQAASMRYLRALRQLKSILGGSPSLWLES